MAPQGNPPPHAFRDDEGTWQARPARPHLAVRRVTEPAELKNFQETAIPGDPIPMSVFESSRTGKSEIAEKAKIAIANLRLQFEHAVRGSHDVSFEVGINEIVDVHAQLQSLQISGQRHFGKLTVLSRERRLLPERIVFFDDVSFEGISGTLIVTVSLIRARAAGSSAASFALITSCRSSSIGADRRSGIKR